MIIISVSGVLCFSLAIINMYGVRSVLLYWRKYRLPAYLDGRDVVAACLADCSPTWRRLCWSHHNLIVKSQYYQKYVSYSSHFIVFNYYNLIIFSYNSGWFPGSGCIQSSCFNNWHTYGLIITLAVILLHWVCIQS